MRKKTPGLEQALVVERAHQRCVLRQQLQHIDFLQTAIEQCSTEITVRLAPN
jgi:hypothetical protein